MNLRQGCCARLARVLRKIPPAQQHPPPLPPSPPSPPCSLRPFLHRSPASMLAAPLLQQWEMSSGSVSRYIVPSTHVSRLSTFTSPMAEKDSDSNSSATETSEEAAKFEQSQKSEPAQTSGEPEPSGKSEEEQSTMPEEDKEAILNSIATIEALIAEKESQLDELRERAVSSKVELENVKARLQRESDNARKFAVQGFAKNLLDVADNVRRALMTVPEEVRKALPTDQSETGKHLQSLLEGLIITERELMKVFKKFGIEKFDPVGQQFDPNSHLALFEVPDPSKEAGTVVVVVKVGYMLHDRVLRPAEVGVVRSME